MPENTLIIYEPRKILDLAEKEGKIAPADMKQFGYNPMDASIVLLRLCTIGYLERDGHKTVKPAAYFETGNGIQKKVSGIHMQAAFKLTAEGRNEKPSAGEKYWIEMAPLDETDLDKIMGNSGTCEIKNFESTLAGLKDERGRTIQQALRDELYAAEIHARREDVKQRLRFAANKLLGRRKDG